MNLSISASLTITTQGRLRVQAAILGASGRTLELRVPAIERAAGCAHDGAALAIRAPEATVAYEVDDPTRYLSLDGTVLRMSHSDLHASWKLSALLPTPFDLDERFALEIDLPAGFRMVASNADGPEAEGRIWRDTARLDPYFVASSAPMERFVAAARPGGREVTLISLGQDLTGPAVEILERLGGVLGPLITPRIVIDATRTLPPMEYRAFVRTDLKNLRHELAHQWFGTSTRTTRPSDLWIDEAAVMLLTEATRPEIDGSSSGLLEAPNGCIPRMAYHYGADTLRRAVDSREDLFRLLRTLIDGGLSSADRIREQLTPERRAWFDRRLSGPEDPSADHIEGTRVQNDIAEFVFGRSPLAAMASAAQLYDGPVCVKVSGDIKAVAYRYPSGTHYREYWALEDGFRLGPASASDPAVTRNFNMPNNQPSNDTWNAFQTWANNKFAGAKDWYDHDVTPK